MTTATAETTSNRSDTAAESTGLRRLRLVLTTNAATSFGAGTIGLAAASWLSDELGFGHVALTRGIGIALMLFAVDVAVLARSGPDRVLRWAPAVSMADFAWVAATIGVIGSGTLTSAGVVVAVAMGVGVLDFGLLQLWLRKRARG